jgi:multiple sugar transport system ATP-binding protein
MAEVVLEAVTKQFRGTTAVDAIDLTFANGQLTVLVGPSGCGKTTLLRMIAGLEEPSSGYIYIGDEVVNAVPAWERDTAMVFQSYALYPHMSVFNNLAFPLRARNMPRAEIDTLVAQAARALDITELLDRKPRQLSGGQMQRVALGRAIVRRPAVFLLDEPLSNLDAMLRVETRAELKRLQRDLTITTIYVTHDQEEAMTLADTLVVMNAGHIEQVGPPEQLYRSPRTLFVARFIGSPAMNIIPGTYDAASRQFCAAAFTYPLPARLHGALDQAGSPEALQIGIRPEHITLHTTPQPDAVAARVYMFELLGKETLFTLSLGETRETRIKVLAEPDVRPALNEPVWLTFADDALHLFDAGSGLAL